MEVSDIAYDPNTVVSECNQQIYEEMLGVDLMGKIHGYHKRTDSGEHGCL